MSELVLLNGALPGIGDDVAAGTDTEATTAKESVGTVEAFVGEVVDFGGADTKAELGGVPAVGEGGVVLQFVVILYVVRGAASGAAADEGVGDVELRGIALGLIRLGGAVEHKVRFVDGAGAEDEGVDDLAKVFGFRRVVAASGQEKRADTGRGFVVRLITVAEAEGVALAELPIDAGTDGETALRGGEEALGAEGVQRLVEDGGVDDAVVVDVAAIDVEKEAGSLGDGAADIAAEALRAEGRIDGEKRVARVPDVIADGVVALPVELVGAGFGEDLDAAIAELVEFSGEGVGVDADFANGLLGREGAAAETVDVDLIPSGTGGRAGEGLEVGLQIVGVVGESVEILAGEGGGTGVVGRVHADLVVGFGNVELLLLFADGEDDVGVSGLAGFDVDGQGTVLLKPLKGGDNRVSAGSNAFEGEGAISGGWGGLCFAVGAGQGDECAGNDAAGGVFDRTGDDASPT